MVVGLTCGHLADGHQGRTSVSYFMCRKEADVRNPPKVSVPVMVLERCEHVSAHDMNVTDADSVNQPELASALLFFLLPTSKRLFMPSH